MVEYPVMEPEFRTANHGSARDFLTIVFKHKAKIVTVFVAVVLTALIGSFLMAPTYEAKTSILMKIGREHLNRSDLGENNPVNFNLRQEEIINSEIQILTNRDLVERVITSMKVENIYPDLAKMKKTEGIKPLDVAVLRFQENLKVENVQKSNVVEVTFRHEKPAMAALALNTLVEKFKEKHLEVYSDPRSSFFESQLTEYEQKLKESADKLETFKQKSGVYSLEEQRSLLLRQRTDIDTTYKASQHVIDELHRKLATLRKQFGTVSRRNESYTPSERERVITEAKSRLLALQLNDQELRRRYNDNSRFVTSNQDEINVVQKFLRDQEHDVRSNVKTINPVYQGLEVELMRTEADLNSQRAKSATLHRQLAEVDLVLKNLDLREKDFQSLSREVDTNEKNRQVYREKAEEARIADDMNKRKLANISVIQQAAPPLQPVSPKKGVNLGLGIIIGIISGLALAFLAESLSQTISAPGTAEKRIGLPVLAVIPQKD